MYHFRQIECCDTLNQYCCLRTISGTYNRPFYSSISRNGKSQCKGYVTSLRRLQVRSIN